MTRNRVLLIDDPTSYGFNSALIAVIAGGFQRKGLVPIVLNLQGPSFPAKFRQLLKDRESFALAFSVGRGLVKLDGQYLHRHFGIPFFSAFVDHPLYKVHFIDFQLDDVIYGFCDPEHVRFCRSFFGKSSYVHFPHFSLVPPIDPFDEDMFFQREKRIFLSASAAIMGREWAINASRVEHSPARKLQERGVPITEFVEARIRDGASVAEALSCKLPSNPPITHYLPSTCG